MNAVIQRLDGLEAKLDVNGQSLLLHFLQLMKQNNIHVFSLPPIPPTCFNHLIVFRSGH